MKKLVVIAAAVLIAVAGTIAGVLAAEEQKGPRIEFKQDRFEFGQVKQGEQAVHVFEFRNSGDAVLEIQKVQTS
jgi:cbb3-type cytochrome oxidase subunit 1